MDKQNYTIKEIYDMVKTDEYGTDLYSKFQCKISIYVTYLLYRTTLTANQATLLMLFIGFAAAIAFSFNQMFLGIILLHLWYMFDWVDGALARLKNQTSKTGWYYDHLIHLLNHPLFFVSISYGLYTQKHSIYILILGIVAAYAHLVDVSASDTYMMVLYRGLLDQKVELKVKQHKNANNIFAQWLHFPNIINIFSAAIVLDYIIKFLGFQKTFNTTSIIICFYGIALPIYVVLRFIKHIKNKVIDEEFNSML